MAPLIVSALVGIGVKIATDLFMSGAKKIMRQEPSTPPAGATFANSLDKAAGATAAAPMTAAAGNVALDAGLADRSRVVAQQVGAPGASSAGRAWGVANYRRFDDVQAP